MFNYISNTILYFIAMTLPKLAGLILLPLYSLYITPADFGIYGYINTIVIFIAVLSSLALNAFYLRYYPLNEDKKEINGTIFWFMCLWNIFLLATGLTITYVFWDFAEVSFDYMPYMPIALVGQFFNSMEIIPMRTYRIRGEAKYYLYRVLAKCILTILFAYVFVVHFRLGALGRLYSDFLNAMPATSSTSPFSSIMSTRRSIRS